MALKERIEEDFKRAMKEGEKDRLSTLRMLKSSIQNREIELGRDLDDEEVQEVLDREAKSRRESIEQFEEGGRSERAQKEREELELIQNYLPEPLTDEELERMVEGVIEEVEADDPSDLGTVMQQIMPQVRGRANGERVNERVREKLS